MKITLNYQGRALVATIPNPTVGQFVTLTAGSTRIRLYWDGKRFVLPQAHVVDAAQIVASAVEEAQEDVAPRNLPDWVYESRDPRITMLREQSGPNYDAFQELRAAGAWQQALLMQEMRAERKARTGAGPGVSAARQAGETTRRSAGRGRVGARLPLPAPGVSGHRPAG